MSSPGEHSVSQVSLKEVGGGKGEKERGLFDYIRLVYSTWGLGCLIMTVSHWRGRWPCSHSVHEAGWLSSQHLALKAWRALEACWPSVHTGIPKKLVLVSAEEWCSIRTGKLGSKNGASRQTAASISLGWNFPLQIISLPGVLQLEF